MASWAPRPASDRFDWRPASPPNIRGAPKGVPPTRSAPLSSPEPTGPTSPTDFDWTSEGTDVFLGRGAATTRRSRSPIGVWCRRNAWNQSKETKVGAEEERRARDQRRFNRRRHGTTRSLDDRGPDRCWAAGDSAPHGRDGGEERSSASASAEDWACAVLWMRPESTMV